MPTKKQPSRYSFRLATNTQDGSLDSMAIRMINESNEASSQLIRRLFLTGFVIDRLGIEFKQTHQFEKFDSTENSIQYTVRIHNGDTAEPIAPIVLSKLKEFKGNNKRRDYVYRMVSIGMMLEFQAVSGANFCRNLNPKDVNIVEMRNVKSVAKNTAVNLATKNKLGNLM